MGRQMVLYSPPIDTYKLYLQLLLLLWISLGLYQRLYPKHTFRVYNQILHKTHSFIPEVAWLYEL